MNINKQNILTINIICLKIENWPLENQPGLNKLSLAKFSKIKTLLTRFYKMFQRAPMVYKIKHVKKKEREQEVKQFHYMTLVLED